MMPAFYDFFRKLTFRPNVTPTLVPGVIVVDTTIEADSVKDTATIIAGQNISFGVTDTLTGLPGDPNTSTDTVTINGPDYQTYVPLGTTKLRLELNGGDATSDIELQPDPLSPILITRTASNIIKIGSNNPSLPFSQEQIEDLSAALLTNGTHTELTVTYQDFVTLPSTFAQDATNGSGINAVFNLSIINNLYVASVVTAGSGYAVGNTVTIHGTNFPGGLNPANNATITVGTVDGTGGILTITSVTGTPIASDNIDLAVTSTLENVTTRGASSTNAITISNATGSSNTSTGALKLTAGGLAVFENANIGGYVQATTLRSTQATGTAPFTVASTTAVANLQAATASKWHTARTITLGGDLSGNVSIDGSADVTLNATVISDAVALGTDTTGSYVAIGAVSGNGLSGSANSETATFTVSSNATSVNTGETIVFRNTNGDFAARTISLASITKTGTTGVGDIGQSGNTFGTIYATTFSGIATNVSGIVAVANGGTGSGVAATGLSNLGGVPLAGGVNMTGSLYTRGAFGMRSSTIAGNPIMYDVQDQAGATVLEIGRADNVAATTAIDIHTGATSVDYDTRLEFTGGNGVSGNGALTIRAATVTLQSAGIFNSTATLGASTIEAVSIVPSALTGAITLNAKTNSVHYYTVNATANWTLNFRGDASTTMNAFLTTGQSVTVVLLATQGGTAYYPTAFTVDGTAVGVTVEWLGAAAPTGGNASGIDSYSFTIIKTGASAYTVLSSQARFA